MKLSFVRYRWMFFLKPDYGNHLESRVFLSKV